MAFPWLTVGIVGAAGVGAVLYARSKAAASTSGSSPCDAICEAAASQGIPVDACKDGAAYQACKAGLGIWNDISEWFNGPDWEAMDAQNKKLNGEVELALGPLAGRTVAAINRMPAMHGTVLRFKNGGVPFKGFPGWELCAPGTLDMFATSGTSGCLVLDMATGQWVPLDPSAAFTGRTGDPTSGGPFTADHTVTLPTVVGGATLPGGMKVPGGIGPKKLNELPFPLPLAGAAQGYYWQGVPFVCAAGTSPDWNVHDHRDGGAPPPCAPGGHVAVNVPTGPVLGAGQSGGGVSTGGGGGGVSTTCPPGSVTVRDHRTGETRCEPSSSQPLHDIIPIHVQLLPQR